VHGGDSCGTYARGHENLADAQDLAALAEEAPNNSYVSLLVLAGIAASDVI
jgi:hypothetical protein